MPLFQKSVINKYLKTLNDKTSCTVNNTFKHCLLNVFILFLTMLILNGCHKINDNNDYNSVYGLSTETIIVDDLSRRYAVYVPPDLGTAPAALVFELHGGGIYIEDMTGESGYKTPYKLWMTLADKEKFIVIYPEGLNGAYGKPTWNDCRANSIVSSDADDVHFISSLIDKISTQYNIDQSRIYASGTSNGGLMALRLAVELSDRVAAVAAVAAAMPDSSDCGSSANPISVLFMNGTDDNHLPYNGGTISSPPNPDYGTVFSAETSVEMWTTFDQTDSIPSVYFFPDLDPDDGGMVVKYTYANGEKNAQVILYKVLGGGHSAPSIKEHYSALFEKYFNKQNHDIEITTEVWNFFKNKTLN